MADLRSHAFHIDLLRRYSNWLLLVSWLALIYSLSSQSHPSVFWDQLFGWGNILTHLYVHDKAIHATVWAALTVFLWFATARLPYQSKWQQGLFILSLAVCFGSFDECHQYFIPSRSFSLLDLAADSLGSLVALCVLFSSNFLKEKQYFHFQGQPET